MRSSNRKQKGGLFINEYFQGLIKYHNVFSKNIKVFTWKATGAQNSFSIILSKNMDKRP